MKENLRALFVSTYPPRVCGIGTFTRDLTANMRKEVAWIRPRIAAIDIADDDDIEYGDEVVCRVRNRRKDAYASFADRVNRADYDVVCLQHEFGLFAGEWGKDIIDFYTTCNKPIVTTLHTVLPGCPDLPRKIIRIIVKNSLATVVMARVGVEMLRSYYGIGPAKLVVIPHGVPSFRRVGGLAAKRMLGLRGREVVSNFGLLSRGKGLEYMVAAMAEVVRERPNAICCILGQTHPQVKKQEGESYRKELRQMVLALGLQNHVQFVDRFLSDQELAIFLEATDVYVTPYVGADQITSGTLARAMFFGKAIVSTPFLYATELLANGRGRLAPFKDSAGLARQVTVVLSDDALRARLQANARAYGRGMSWEAVARKYARVLREVKSTGRVRTPVVVPVRIHLPQPQQLQAT